MQESGETSVILILIENFRLLLPVEEVRYIIRSTAIAPIPDAPPFVIGTVNYHGELLPVVDLRIKFSLPPKPLSIHQYFAIVAGNAQQSFAIIIDEIAGLHTLPHSLLKSDADRIVGEGVISMALQIDNETAYVLDTQKMFNTEKSAFPANLDIASWRVLEE